MVQFKALKNTDKEYSCTSCGETNVSIIREDPAGQNPRLKCNSCSFMFNGADSSAMQDAGIKPSSAETLATADEPEVETIHQRAHMLDGAKVNKDTSKTAVSNTVLPRIPTHIFISKDRKEYEVCSKRTFRETAIKWSAKKCDVYELNKISLNVKVDIS